MKKQFFYAAFAIAMMASCTSEDTVAVDPINPDAEEKVAIEYMNSCNMNTSEVIFVGDSIHDFEVANAINVKAILVSTGHTNKDRLLKVTSDVIDSLSEIKKYL